MFYRIFPLTVLLLGVISSFGQSPQNISISDLGFGISDIPTKSEIRNPQSEIALALACADQDAGTIGFSNFVGQSNDISLDTIFLCFNDQINIVHNGDANLTGDPNPLTQPGITYGFFDCPPTVSGPNLTSILTDPCIIDMPPPAEGIWVTAGGSANGNITFNNTGTLQNFFNGGNPLLIWFAPLTIDNFAIKQYENDPGTGEHGPCVNLNTAERFAVVYLNTITFNNFDNSQGLSGCRGSVNVFGGLPQFDGSNYDITITLIGDPNVHGTVTNGSVTHSDPLIFEVPTAGVYQITVEDGKSCGGIFLADMSACVSVSQEIDSLTAAPGDQICVPVTNVDGFLDIVSMQYALTWDPTVLQFDHVANLTNLLPNFTAGNSFNTIGNDSLVFSWLDPTTNGVNLPDGTVLYELCFDIVGGDGDCTDIQYVDLALGSGIEVFNGSGSQLGFDGTPGLVCVSNAALVVNFVQDSVSCSGATDGRFTVTVSGGQPPYSVTWQNTAGGTVQGPGTINTNGGSFATPGNLAAGTYSVTIADAQGVPLTVVEQVEVFSPPILSINMLESGPLCFGLTGSITAVVQLDGNNVPNAELTYDFSWTNGATSQTISNLPSGPYAVTVTQTATGCTTSAFTFLQQPSPLTLNLNLTPATCSGVGDGTISLQVTGGSPDANQDYVIQWPDLGGGLTVIGDMSNVTGVPSDHYLVVVTDNNGCVVDSNIFLPAVKVLSVNALVQQVTCDNACNGSIFITGTTSGGVPSLPYNFDWFGTPPPPPPVATTATTSLLNNLCVGIYTVVMEDAAGCEIDTTFIITEPEPIDVIVVDVQDETCQPGNDGSITVAVTGGEAPFSYAWNAPGTDSTATGLSAGTYTVTVQDNNQCFDTVSATVIAPAPPTIDLLENDTLSCGGGNNGSLTVTATPGSAAITSYDWSNSMTGSTINGLAAGTYIVTVSDANLCEAVDTAQVVALPPLVLDSFNIVQPQCPGQSGGSIILYVSGGATPYFFNWSNGVSGTGLNVLAGLTAGIVTVTIVDANNCAPITQTINLPDPPSIVVTFSALDTVSCANSGQTCDGQATATALYSDGSSGTFDFTWQSGENTQNAQSSSAAQLCAGAQQLTVSDGTCFIDTTVTILAPPPITPGQDITNVSCNGLSDGEITLLPSGGTPPYLITWAGGQTGSTITSLPAGNYTATIEDSKSCSFTHTVIIIEPDVFDVFLNQNSTSDISCPGEQDGILTVEVQGGNINLGAPTFIWAGGIASSTANSAQNLPPGTYSVTVVDPLGCEDSLSHTLSEPPPIQFTLGQMSDIGCFGSNTFITVDSVWGGNQATYQFNVDQGINRLPGEPAPIFAGEHTIEVVDVVNGCTADTTIFIEQPQELVLELPEVVEIELGDSLTRLDPTILSTLPIDTFLWSPPDQLSCTDCKNPLVNAVQSMLYTLTIVDVNGCSATAQVFVDVDKNRNVYIPNIFSPNGDGFNDKFQVFTGVGVVNINFARVYDRWGELVFEDTNVPPSPDGTPGWDGVFRGQRMKPAVFMYLVEVEFLDGEVLLYRGDVTLVR
ncbi:MAG: gliding motility-associated C-terminal domain-containing protein [Bacteroidota bacterium]